MKKEEIHKLMDRLKTTEMCENHFLEKIQDRIRYWEIERTKMRETKNERGFLISREGDIHIANVVIQELKDLSNSIAPRSNSPTASAEAEDLICVKEEFQK